MEILKKLDPQTDTAKKLREIINARVTRWHQKAYKQRQVSRYSASTGYDSP